MSTFSRMYSVSVPRGVQRKPDIARDVAEARDRATHVCAARGGAVAISYALRMALAFSRMG